MSRYTIEVTKTARKEIEALPDPVLSRVVRGIDALAAEPRPSGCRKLKGYKDQWRIRIGDYRVIYIVDDKIRIVSVTRVAHRREVYD